MKRHVFGTFLLGITISCLVTYAVYYAGFPDLAYLVAAFFGAVTGVATVTDYIEQKDRQKYDQLALPDPPKLETIGTGQITYVGTSEDDIPDEVREIIEHFISENAPPAAVIKVTKMESAHKVEPQLSKEELDEIEEKFS